MRRAVADQLDRARQPRRIGRVPDRLPAAVAVAVAQADLADAGEDRHGPRARVAVDPGEGEPFQPPFAQPIFDALERVLLSAAAHQSEEQLAVAGRADEG